MEHILLWLPKRLRNAALRSAVWGRRHLLRTVLTVTVAMFFNVLLMAAGLVTSWVAFEYESVRWIGIGRFITAFSALLAAGFWLYGYIRLWILGQAARIADDVVIQGVHVATKPLPGGEETTVKLDSIITEERVNGILRAVMSGLAAVMAGNAYACFVPVYTSLAGFCAVLVIGYFLAFATWQTPAGDHKTPAKMFSAQKWLVPVAIVAIVIATYSFYHPYQAERDLVVSLAKGRTIQVTTPLETDALWRVTGDRNTLLAKLGTTNWTRADQNRLEELNRRIQDVEDGKYTGQTTLKRAVTDSVSSAAGAVTPRRWHGQHTVLLLFVAVVLAWGLSRKFKTGGGE